MLTLDIKQAKNSQPTFEVNLSDTKFEMVLPAATEVNIVVPDGANKVNLTYSGGDIYWSKQTFTMPSSATPVSSVAELKPGLRTVAFGETIYIQAINAGTHVSVSFFSGGA